MTDHTIRALALCVFFHEERIFVQVIRDQQTQQTMYRPLGGAIEFGEHGRDAIAREIREEIGAEITNLLLIDTLENLFTYEGKSGHEIVQVYAAEFVEQAYYQMDVVSSQDEHGHPIQAMWKPLADFTEDRDTLVPTGLLKILLDWLDMLGMLKKHRHPGEGGEGEFDWEQALRDIGNGE